MESIVVMACMARLILPDYPQRFWQKICYLDPFLLHVGVRLSSLPPYYLLSKFIPSIADR